jgi:hypothetical protein
MSIYGIGYEKGPVQRPKAKLLALHPKTALVKYPTELTL